MIDAAERFLLQLSNACSIMALLDRTGGVDVESSYILYRMVCGAVGKEELSDGDLDKIRSVLENGGNYLCQLEEFRLSESVHVNSVVS